MDQYRPPADLKLEVRPRHATTMAEWHRDAKREAWCRGLFYGTEHYQPLVDAADELLRLHEDDPNAWPRDEVWDVWAELSWRWCEEMRETRRSILREMQDDNPTIERLRFYCLARDEEGRPPSHCRTSVR